LVRSVASAEKITNLYKICVITPVVNTQNEKPRSNGVMIKWIPMK
jgi:hypothetical protein